jgi:hypothetical protein
MNRWGESSSIHVKVRNIDSIEECERFRLVKFACEILGEPTNYLSKRFPKYDFIIIAEQEDNIKAIQLVNQFQETGAVYVYFGPVFSRIHYYLPMFLSFFESLLTQFNSKTLYLIAEIQIPELLVIFQTLFGRYVFPHIHSQEIPIDIQEAAVLCQSRLHHIENLNKDLLLTKSCETLYRPKKGYEDVEKWLEKRGVFLRQGDSQMVVVHVPEQERDRNELRNYMNDGIKQINDWKRTKSAMLEKYREAMADDHDFFRSSS